MTRKNSEPNASWERLINCVGRITTAIESDLPSTAAAEEAENFAARLEEQAASIRSEFGLTAPNEPATDAEIVADANALACLFYKGHGYEVPETYKFYEATHPQESGMWNLAVMAYDHINGTDVECALQNVLDDEDDA